MAIINSPFEEFVSKIFPKLSLYVTEKTNNSGRELTYLHKQRLRPVYSPTQKWEGTSANTRLVAADMVAMDSPLPLKKRSSISKVSGDLPKMGLSKQMLESDMNAINIMRAEMNMIADTDANAALRKQKYQQILNRFADDGYACSYGIDERNEYNYLYGISNGVVLVENEESKNTGIGMRVSYGYSDNNIFGLIDTGEICGDDIENVVTKADAKGVTFATAMLSKTLLTTIRRSRWARELAADYKEQTYTDATKLPVPSVKIFTEAFENEYNISLTVVDRSILIEKNGTDTSVKPFNANRIIFLPNADTDGSLVWGTLAEATNPVEGINYSTVDQYKLISRYRTNEPSLMEITKGQAMVLPVIEDVEKIFVLDITKGLELDPSDATDAGAVDTKITINGTAYVKTDVISALKELGVNVKSNAKDETVIKAINALSDGDMAALMDSIKDSKASA